MERGAHVFAVDLDPQMNLTTFYVVNGGDLPVNNINDLLPVDYMAYMLKYDTMHGQFDGTIEVDRNGDRRLSANYPYAAQTAVRLYHHRHELSDQSADDQCSYRCGR